MPIKKTLNTIHLNEHEDVLSFFTHNKRNHFTSESKLYDSLVTGIRNINVDYLVHLTTYPFIAVHISYGLVGDLDKNKERIRKAIDESLSLHLRHT